MSFDAAGRLVHAWTVVLGHGADEHAGAAAAQGVRDDPGPFERLPRRLQQQPLLRVHRQRLTRTDPEELRIEITRVPQETPLPHIRLPRHPRIRIEQTLHIPAPVHRKIRHRIHPTRHQPPQILRRPHIPRIAAGHPHNGQRFTEVGRGGGLLGRLGAVLVVAGQAGPEAFDHGAGRGVVVEEGGGELQAGGLVEPVAQLDRGHRVDAQGPEGLFGAEGGGCRVAEEERQVGVQQVEENAALFPVGQAGRGQLFGEAVVGVQLRQ
ncbi:hypothetical protein STBA_68020 [Streptomyces sp. MP131-18]|nr:hypothetical protein STBA_68020 [Streptomyces sp. MP131-18]